jgi:colanic acid biosynthesis protein WcaH
MGQRLNRPAQGFWFVPGGRVLKDETLENAFNRLIKAELGLEAQAQATYKGTYQHFYEDNVSNEDSTTYYVVLAYEIEVNIALESLPRGQHGDYRWLTEQALLGDSNVHQYTKLYFQKGHNSDAPFMKLKIWE